MCASSQLTRRVNPCARRCLQDFASNECGHVSDEAARAEQTNSYNAYQLVAQLQFADVTLEHAREALAQADGKIEAAASALLEKAGM